MYAGTQNTRGNKITASSSLGQVHFLALKFTPQQVHFDPNVLVSFPLAA